MWMITDQTTKTEQLGKRLAASGCIPAVDASCVALDWEAIGKMVRERTERVVALHCTAMGGLAFGKNTQVVTRGGQK